jgi:hypothetical protein
MSIGGIFSPDAVKKFTAWADKVKNLHMNPCENFPDGKHKWRGRPSLLGTRYLIGCECGAIKPERSEEIEKMTEAFNPDWVLPSEDRLAVYLSITLSRNIPDWLGATDEQISAVAKDILGLGTGVWQPIATFPDMRRDKRLKDGVLLWNPCDGIHLVHPSQYHDQHWFELLFILEEDRNRTFSHWAPISPPQAEQQIEEERSDDTATAEKQTLA